MPKYSFEISIDAPSEAEACDKLKAATILMQKLREKEITKLAEVVKNDPLKLAIAKKAMGL